MIILLAIVMSIFASVCYRAGGLSKEQPYWIPIWMRHSWVRDWLCPLFVLLPLFVQSPHWIFIPVYGIMGGFFTTYWDFLFKEDNFWVSGLAVGSAMFPLVFAGFVWYVLLAKAVFICVSWGLLCKYSGNDHVEEHGRGFLASIHNIV